MTAVVDITCPDCERADPVVKVSLDRYRCQECDREFSHGDILP